MQKQNIKKVRSTEKRSVSKESRKSFTIRKGFDTKKIFSNIKKKENIQDIFFLCRNQEGKTKKKKKTINQRDLQNGYQYHLQKQKCDKGLSFLNNLDNLQNLQKEVRQNENNNQNSIGQKIHEFVNSTIFTKFCSEIKCGQFDFNTQKYSFVLEERNKYQNLCQEFYQVYTCNLKKNKKPEYLDLEHIKKFFMQYIKLIKNECLQKGQILETMISLVFQTYEYLIRKRTQQIVKQSKVVSDKFQDNLKQQKFQNLNIQEIENDLKKQNRDLNILLKVAQFRNTKSMNELHVLRHSWVSLKVKCQILYDFWGRFEDIRRKFDIIKQTATKEQQENQYVVLQETERLLRKVDDDYLYFTKWTKVTDVTKNFEVPEDLQHLLNTEYKKDLNRYKSKQTQTIEKKIQDQYAQTENDKVHISVQTEKPPQIMKTNASIQVNQLQKDLYQENVKLQKKIYSIKQKYQDLYSKIYGQSESNTKLRNQNKTQQKNFQCKLKDFWQIGPTKFQKMQKKFADFYIPFPNKPKYYSLSQIIKNYKSDKAKDRMSQQTVKLLFIDFLKSFVNENNQNPILVEFFQQMYKKYGGRKQGQRQCINYLKEIFVKNKEKGSQYNITDYSYYLLDTKPFNFSNFFMIIIVQAIKSLDVTQSKKVLISILKYKQLKSFYQKCVCKKTM